MAVAGMLAGIISCGAEQPPQQSAQQAEPAQQEQAAQPQKEPVQPPEPAAQPQEQPAQPPEQAAQPQEQPVQPEAGVEEPAAQILRPSRIFPHEQLDYAVTSWVGNAATIAVNVGPQCLTEDGAPAHFVTYTINTVGLMSRIYIIRGRVTALIDAETLLPYEYAENVKAGVGITGGSIKRIKLEFDRSENLLRYYRAERDRRPIAFRRSREIPPDTHHLSSLLYFFRYYDDYEVGKEITVPMSDRKRDFHIIATVLREENYVTSPGLSEAAYVLEMDTDFGSDAVRQTSLTVWLDKREHYPVRLDARTRWGRISASLVRRTVTENDAPADEECRDNPSEI